MAWGRQMVFAYTSRSLFKADRLTFGMHFVRHLQREHVDDSAWEFFLGTRRVSRVPIYRNFVAF